MDQINIAIIVPQRTGVDVAVCFLYQNRSRPFTVRVFCFEHKNPAVRVAVVNVKPSLMETEGGCPNSVPVLWLIECWIGKPFNGMVDNFPVDQVCGMEDWQPRNAVKRGSSHVKVVTNLNNVRVGIIRVNDWVFISSVSQVRNPWFRIQLLSVDNNDDNQ